LFIVFRKEGVDEEVISRTCTSDAKDIWKSSKITNDIYKKSFMCRKVFAGGSLVNLFNL
jgi:hypothetical protein